jgi:hypothetical protein
MRHAAASKNIDIGTITLCLAPPQPGISTCFGRRARDDRSGDNPRTAPARPAAACCAPLAAAPLSADGAAATAALFKALADPHRVRIVNLLATCPELVCVCPSRPSSGRPSRL